MRTNTTIALIEQAGVQVRFPPAYSPNLNPIEIMWSKVKALLRKALPRPACSHRLRPYTPRCPGWFAACCYNFI